MTITNETQSNAFDNGRHDYLHGNLPVTDETYYMKGYNVYKNLLPFGNNNKGK